MNEAALALGNIFLAEKKSDVEKLCRAALIDEGTLSKFIHLCQCGLLPWNHHIETKDRYPVNRKWTDEDMKRSRLAGSDDAIRAKAKWNQLMIERRLLVGHLFYLPDYSNWQFFYFDNRDLQLEKNHFKNGGRHIHLINHLSLPNGSPEDVLKIFQEENPQFKGSFHIRFHQETRELF
jgi:hypothetical protein